MELPRDIWSYILCSIPPRADHLRVCKQWYSIVLGNIGRNYRNITDYDISAMPCICFKYLTTMQKIRLPNVLPEVNLDYFSIINDSKIYNRFKYKVSWYSINTVIINTIILNEHKSNKILNDVKLFYKYMFKHFIQYRYHIYHLLELARPGILSRIVINRVNYKEHYIGRAGNILWDRLRYCGLLDCISDDFAILKSYI